MIPLYGFLEGDTLGLLVLADEDETIAALAEKLQRSAQTRVAPKPELRVVYNGSELGAKLTVQAAGLEPLGRFDVRITNAVDESSLPTTTSASPLKAH